MTDHYHTANYILSNELNTTHSINATVPSKSADFSILSINIRSIREKLSSLENLLQTHTTITHCIVITETWLYANETDMFDLSDYTAYHSTRESKRGGGCSIYLHNSISYSNVIFNKEFDGNNIIGVNVKTGNSIYNIFAVYRVPNSNITNFFNNFSYLLRTFNSSLFLGDFNINLLNKDEDPVVDEYLQIIHSSGYLVLNKEHPDFFTRKGLGAKTIIDHIITDCLSTTYSIVLHDTHLSDHRYIYALLRKPTKNSTPTSLTHTKRVIDYCRMSNDEEAKSELKNSPNINMLISKTQDYLSKYTQTKTIKKKYKLLKPWMTNDILDNIKDQDKFFKLKTNHPANNFFQEKFTYYRNKTNYLTKQAKKNYYSQKYNANANNPKEFWTITKEIIFNKTNKKTNQKISLKLGSTLLTNNTDIANHFNNFFINVGITTNSEYHPAILSSLTPITSNFYIRKTTPQEVLDTIDSLNANSANGFDNIPVKFLKNLRHTIHETIAEHINVCIKTSTFPDCLKIAKVTPIYKGGDRTDVGNYRPISVLPAVSKVYEKIIRARLEQYLLDNHLINENQFGFVKNSSTTSACSQLLNFIDGNIDKKFYVGCFFVDLRKAFDSVDPMILFEKMKRLGITNKSLQLFKSYHSNRRQFVSVNNSNSAQENIYCGVPQGSIISTTMFNIFINDIFDINFNGKIQLYADDAVLLYKQTCPRLLLNDIQQDADKLKEWLHLNHLLMNTKKSNYIIFTKNRSIEDINLPEITINNDIISRVRVAKYLGLYIDEKLNWHAHIDHIKNKIRPYVFALRRLRSCLTKNALWNIYFAYIYTHLIHLNPLWSNAGKSKLDELERLQNKALRIIYGYSRLHTRSDLYNAEILPLSKLITLQLLILIFKFKNSLIKHNFTPITRSHIHRYNTRRRSHFDIPYSRTNTGQGTIMSRGLQLFNNLPPHIKNLTRISLFKKSVTRHLMQ